MSDYSVWRPKDPHLFLASKWTVYFGDEPQTGLMKQNEPKTEIIKQENPALLCSGSEDDNAQEQEGISEKERRTIQEHLRIKSNHKYLQCLIIAEETLTRYVSPCQKPMRFLKQFADELFEKRTKHSIAEYHEFLEEKIIELQRRNNSISKYQMPGLALKAGIDHAGGSKYGRP
jgi:hypothetical protein